jgi:acetyl-CoA C-acetyltransferase
MAEPVIIAAVRTPIGKRNGSLSGLKAVELLKHVQVEVISRAGLAPGDVDQIAGGCVTQIGEQSLNVTRNAWLNTGLDYRVAATTIDTSCGSSQQACHMIAGLIAAGAIDVGIACGVESMSRVPIGTNLYSGPGHYKTQEYPWDDPPRAQFGGAERIAGREGFSRADVDEFALRSQTRAAAAQARGDFKAEICPIAAPPADIGDENPSERPGRMVSVDEGIRATTADGLAGLRATAEGGIHTAGNSSQISDGAAAVLFMSAARARELGLRPRARLLHQAVVGADPYFLLDGPIEATRRILGRSGLRVEDMDRYEINEAFAAVPLAWLRATAAHPERLNPAGGAIALGHPLGATGARLIVTILHELERADAELGLVSMCCGGSLGTASILQRM